MSCFSELTYSIYADGELSTEEAHRVEAHLAVCSRCQALLVGLRTENRLLTEVLQRTEEDPFAVASSPRVVVGMVLGFLSMLAVALAFVMAVTWLAKLFPSAADWLSPFNRTVLLNLFFSAILYLAEEGAAMLHSILTTLSALMLGLLVVGCVRLLVRRRSAPVALLAGLVLAFTSTPSGSALERRKGATVTVPSSQTVDTTLLANAETTNIDGTVNGDLIAFSRRVVIKGSVKGDVLCFCQTVDMDGTVGGNIYGFVQSLSVRGSVARSVYAWVQSFQLDPAGRVDADVVAGGAEVSLQGTVGRDVTFGGGSAELRGKIGRDLQAYTDNLTVAAPARVGGNLTAHVHKKEHVQIDPGASVTGKTEIRLREKSPSRYAKPSFYFWQGIQLIAALLIGLVLFWLFPAPFRARLDKAGPALRAVGVGFLILVATPVAAIIAGITLIGLPIALMGLATWLAGLYLSKVFVAALVGQAMMGPPVGQPRRFALALLLGLLIVYVAINLPYLGGWVSFLVILLGLGVAFTQVRSHWPRAQAVT